MPRIGLFYYEKEELEKYKQLLINSKQSLQKRHPQLTSEDIEADVINVACRHILEEHRNEIVSDHDAYKMHECAADNMKFSPIANAFAELAKLVYPNAYNEGAVQNAKLGIIQNISWAGMWDFLRDYYAKKHNVQIDTIKSETDTFYSSRHERFQNNEMVSASDVERIIMLNFFKNKKEVIVSIEPTLSAKKANLISRDENVLKYHSLNEEYIFHISIDFIDDVDKFVLEIPGRNLKIIYYD